MRPELSKLQIPLPIAIIGLGLSGESAKALLLSMGVESSQILTFDQKNSADYQDPDLLLSQAKPRSLCVSPGVPLQQLWIQDAVAKGLRLTSELELAFACLTSEKVIAVTGSVGKSTTVSILGQGALQVDPDAFVGGNLGTPLADYSRQVLEGGRTRAKLVVLELSSYQLENFNNLKAGVSVLTHLSPNHLERYRDLNHYYQTKTQLFAHTTEFGLLNRSGGHIASLLDQIQKNNPKLNWQWTDRNDPAFKKLVTEKPALIGAHNLDNLSLTFAVARFLNWPSESYQAMLRFPGLPHRLENCGRRKGILFLNDSKATSMNSVMQALESVRQEFQQDRIHLLLGGKDKNLPWGDLGVLKSRPQMSFSFFGQVGPSAQMKSGLEGPVFPNLVTCLKDLKPKLKSGDIVLLSPGGTSWDEFKNFEERGQFFKNWISSEFQDDKA